MEDSLSLLAAGKHSAWHGRGELFTRTSEVPGADSRLRKAVLLARMVTKGRFLADWILLPRQSLLSRDPGLTSRGEQL